MSNQRALAISVAYMLSIIALGLAWTAYEKSRPKPPPAPQFVYYAIGDNTVFLSQAECERFSHEGKQCVPRPLSDICERTVRAINLCEWTHYGESR